MITEIDVCTSLYLLKRSYAKLFNYILICDLTFSEHTGSVESYFKIYLIVVDFILNLLSFCKGFTSMVELLL